MLFIASPPFGNEKISGKTLTLWFNCYIFTKGSGSRFASVGKDPLYATETLKFRQEFAALQIMDSSLHRLSKRGFQPDL
jgi:hypothetical protein